LDSPTLKKKNHLGIPPHTHCSHSPYLEKMKKKSLPTINISFETNFCDSMILFGGKNEKIDANSKKMPTTIFFAKN
jgi:hypothetical protein